MKINLPLGRLLAFVLLLFTATPASAWWEYGHQTVAQIAMAEVRPATRARVLALLRHAPLLDTPTCPAATPEQAAVWPDCIKALGDRFNYTSSWHYQDVDICRPFDVRAGCRDGNCVSAQIERDLRLLKDRRLPERERVQALVFLIHFVGDVHMPLHAGEHGDVGGNRFRASYGRIPSNLHSIWDGLLADRSLSTPPGGARGLLSELSAEQRRQMAGGNVADWLRESWDVARRLAYGSVTDDPCARAPENSSAPAPVLGEAKIQALIPAVRLQVQRAGLRLARLLDEVMG